MDPVLARSAVAFHARRTKITMEPKSFWTKLNARQLALYGERKPAAGGGLAHRKAANCSGGPPRPHLRTPGSAKADNLTLFLNAVSCNGPQKRRSISIGTNISTARASSLWSYVGATPVKWALVQSGAHRCSAAVYLQPPLGPDRDTPRPFRASLRWNLSIRSAAFISAPAQLPSPPASPIVICASTFRAASRLARTIPDPLSRGCRRTSRLGRGSPHDYS